MGIIYRKDGTQSRGVDEMKEIVIQFRTIWREMKPLQKGITLIILTFVVIVLAYLFFKSTGSSYVPLSVSPSEMEAVRDRLESSGIPFKEHPKKGILVPEAHLEKIRTDSIPLETDRGKGFELFDTNTWIKGEKELQVLEMRALKGQLEKDLTGFDQIQSARVILDMAPPRSFGGKQYKTKASVILTLVPGAKLSTSQLRAITYHLAGAVRGLEPNMIAISDTTGKLYKIIDPNGEEDSLNNGSLIFEEHLEQKMRTLLKALVGEENFIVSVQAKMDKNELTPQSFSIVASINQTHEIFVGAIQKQLEIMASGYEIPFHLTVDAIPFEKKKGLWIETKKKSDYSRLILTICILLLGALSFIPFFRRYTKKKREDSLFKVMTRIDVNKLAQSVEKEDPATIALMLSYLEPVRAEQMIASFSAKLQEEILYHLNELEKEM